MAESEFQDGSGMRITKEHVLKNYTDDARLTDMNWNNRHHVTPSAFNGNNHKYYKVSERSYLPDQVSVCSNTSTRTCETRMGS